MPSLKTTANTWKEIVKTIFKIIIEQLRGAAVKAALKKILGSALAGGFWGWIITFAVEELFDLLVVPLINELQRRGLFLIDVQEGKTQLKLLKKAKDENNEDEYIDIVTNL